MAKRKDKETFALILKADDPFATELALQKAGFRARAAGRSVVVMNRDAEFSIKMAATFKRTIIESLYEQAEVLSSKSPEREELLAEIAKTKQENDGLKKTRDHAREVWEMAAACNEEELAADEVVEFNPWFTFIYGYGDNTIMMKTEIPSHWMNFPLLRLHRSFLDECKRRSLWREDMDPSHLRQLYGSVVPSSTPISTIMESGFGTVYVAPGNENDYAVDVIEANLLRRSGGGGTSTSASHSKKKNVKKEAMQIKSVDHRVGSQYEPEIVWAVVPTHEVDSQDGDEFLPFHNIDDDETQSEEDVELDNRIRAHTRAGHPGDW